MVANRYSSRLAFQSTGNVAPLRVSGILPQSFGGGWASGLNALGKGLELFEQRYLQAEEFDANARLQEGIERYTQETMQARVEEDPTKKEYLTNRVKAFDEFSKQFIDKLPAPLQDRFNAKLANTRRVFAGRELQYQIKAQEDKAKLEIGKATLKAANRVNATPADYEAAKQEIRELVESAPLTAVEKERQLALADYALAAASFKAEVKQVVSTLPQSAADVIKGEEGYRSKAYMDYRTSTGEPDKPRVGYGIDYVIRADGRKETVTMTTVVSRADAERTLKYHLHNVVEPKLRKQLGPRYATLPPNARAALASVAYNYGSLPSSVVRAAKNGNLATLANAVERLKANPDRRKREAAIIRGASVVDANPRYKNLSYEERSKWTAQAERETNVARAKMEREERETQDEKLSQILLGIREGSVGPEDVDAHVMGGEWDFKAISQMDAALKRYQKDALDIQMAERKLADPAYVWDRNDKDDKQAQNLLFGSTGQKALIATDTDYVQKILIPRAMRTGDIPTKAVGMLAAMRSSPDPQKALFALETLSQLRRAVPDAFDVRADSRTASDVSFYDRNKEILPSKDLLERLRGGNTQAERQARAELRKEAETIIRTSTTSGETLFTPEGIAEEFESFWNHLPFTDRVEPPGVPWVKTALANDFKELFKEEYVKYGNVEDAREAALEGLKRLWAPTSIGGQTYLMKHPPHLAGYPPGSDHTFTWIEEKVRKEAKLDKDVTFQLISDEQTASEVGKGASYMVAVTEDGITRILTDPDTGLPRRFNFLRGVEERQAELRSFVDRQRQAEAVAIGRELVRAKRYAKRHGGKLPAHLQAMQERFIRQYGKEAFDKLWFNVEQEDGDIAAP